MNLDSPVPMSDIESVLAWVDTYKLSRPTKKINRDFSDAVLLAEILSTHYPKLVEMHNYPPRNSQSLKLNNWLTLNRKVLRKLRLNLCVNTMEQLANSTPGIVERVLIMVRDKVHRDDEMNKSMREMEQAVSSGGSYYEACSDDDNVLVVPLKIRVNGVLEVIQKKVISYDLHVTLKEELKDQKEALETLKQKVEHLENLLKLKEERIEELQTQLERKQARRKEVQAMQNNFIAQYDEPPDPDRPDIKDLPVANIVSVSKPVPKVEESKIPVPIGDHKLKSNVVDASSKESIEMKDEKTKSDIFKEVAVKEDAWEPDDGFHDTNDFNDKNPTIEDSIQKECFEIYQTNFVLNLHH